MKTDGVHNNATLMSPHHWTAGPPPCSGESPQFDRQVPAPQKRRACQAACTMPLRSARLRLPLRAKRAESLPRSAPRRRVSTVHSVFMADVFTIPAAREPRDLSLVLRVNPAEVRRKGARRPTNAIPPPPPAPTPRW
ncbi:hypothetical protein SKAU_G00363390 [Synaphobranchus kaupii]|uniref:Uncharacterized protein n=1 Tax=Synaphobranchus kaupii TaxID=118154 RepID=A0A9Q1IF61_SYNKA|nr:hypothetical protein SKAU_G00363390 [Synaphobranchus kaupii]